MTTLAGTVSGTGDAMRPWMKVCVTCDRYAPGQGQIGETLADAVERMGAALSATLRRVPCLSGCKHPGNVALGGLSRWQIRLCGLRPENAADIVVLAERYVRAPAGALPVEHWPVALRGKLAVLVPPQ